ncbi:MAG: gliding motility-associated C-terminal domain-containing protein, partial [Schleiferiaceae bacterium]|nr:gliding motility-associated C-terminal domain-containing protein [Schleiferiaceae bacterium]
TRDTLVLPSTGGSAAITPNDSVNGQPAQVGSNATVDTLGTWPSGISLDSTGAVVVAYGTPAGSYPLSYLLCDTMLPPNCDTVEIVVNVATYPPNARPDSALMSQDDTITVSPWANDTDPDGNLNGSSVGIVSGPSNGTASVDSLGNVTYIPDSAWTGVDTITYVVCDSGLVPVQCDTSLIVITVYGLPTITLDGVSQVQCFGDSTGSATVSVGGGLAPYRITWSTTPVQTGPVASQLSAGAYTVTVEDSLGGLTSLTVNITQNDSLEVSYQRQAVSCPGASDASIALNIEGGVPPYQAAWSRGDTGQFLDSLPAGTYQVEITDSLGCSTTRSIEVADKPAIEVADVRITDVFCKSDSLGAIYPEIVGGTAPYQYRWSTGDTATFLDSLAGGTYELLVTDANGCEESFAFSVTWEQEGCTQGVVIPQGVSDNGDGANDAFFIKGLERFDYAKLTIFNRWGTIVYKTIHYQNDWNGQVNRGVVVNRVEDKLPTGVYFYKLQLKEDSKPLSGYIYLDR